MARLTCIGPRVGALAPRVKLAPKVADRFYESKAWRGLAARAKKLAGWACVRCGSGVRLIADHIVERKDGGAELDPANVEVLCHACHQAKTAKARAKRASGGR